MLDSDVFVEVGNAGEGSATFSAQMVKSFLLFVVLDVDQKSHSVIIASVAFDASMTELLNVLSFCVFDDLSEIFKDF